LFIVSYPFSRLIGADDSSLRVGVKSEWKQRIQGDRQKELAEHRFREVWSTPLLKSKHKRRQTKDQRVNAERCKAVPFGLVPGLLFSPSAGALSYHNLHF